MTSTINSTAACSPGKKVESIAVLVSALARPAIGLAQTATAGNAELTTAFLDPDLSGDPTHQGYEEQAAASGTGFTGSWRNASYAICAA